MRKSSQHFCLIEMDRVGSPQPLLPIKRLSCSPSCTHTAAIYPNELARSAARNTTDRRKWCSGVIARQEIRYVDLSSVFLTRGVFRVSVWHFKCSEVKNDFLLTLHHLHSALIIEWLSSESHASPLCQLLTLTRRVSYPALWNFFFFSFNRIIYWFVWLAK